MKAKNDLIYLNHIKDSIMYKQIDNFCYEK